MPNSAVNHLMNQPQLVFQLLFTNLGLKKKVTSGSNSSWLRASPSPGCFAAPHAAVMLMSRSFVLFEFRWDVLCQGLQSEPSLCICMSSRLQWTRQMSHLTASAPVKCVFAYLTTAPHTLSPVKAVSEAAEGGGFRCHRFVTCRC